MRTITFAFEDALISPESFSILSGAGLLDAAEDAPLYVHTTSRVQLSEANTIVLDDIACSDSYADTDDYYNAEAGIYIMTLDDNGQINAEPCIPAETPTYDATAGTTTIICYGHEGTIKKDSVVLVDYYVKKTSGAKMIEITADQFGGNYYLEASTLFRDEATGVDMPAEFIIPNCKVQSNFTFTMAATGDPSTFTFTMDAFPAYTKFDKTKKVLAALQVITDDVDSASEKRDPCEEKTSTDDTAAGGITSVTSKSADVTVSGTTTDSAATLTVSGSNVSSSYDEATFINTNAVGVELDINMNVDDTATYTVVQENPGLSVYFADDSTYVTGDTKTKTYVGSDLKPYQLLVTDQAGDITVKVYEGSDTTGTLLYTYNIKNNVTFAA